MTQIGELTIHIGGIEEMHATLNKILTIARRLDTMATDQAAFDAALTDFLTDLETGLAAIQAKLDQAGTPIDLTAELAQITDAKAKLDAQVAADTGPGSGGG